MSMAEHLIAAQALGYRHLSVGRSPRQRTRDIVREVAEAHGLDPQAIYGRNNTRPVAWPRQEAMWRIRHETLLSLPQIGRLLGDRDHTTILHGIRAHAKRMGDAAP